MGLSNTKWTAIGPAPVSSPSISLGHSAGRIEVAAPDPKNVDVMYLGANGGGVWKTGVWTSPSPVWLPVTDDQPSLNFSGYHPLVVHPANSNLILGAVSGPGAGILKSTNAGLAWTLLANGTFEGAMLGSIAVHPTNQQVLYLSVWTGGAFAGPGVYGSNDGGATWKNLTAFHDGYVSDVVLTKYNPHHLYAGMVRGNQNAGVGTTGVYRSTDEGAHWTLMTGLPSSFFLGSAVRLESAASATTLYATLFVEDINGKVTVNRYRTTDDGQAWSPLAATPGTPELRSWHMLLAVDPKDHKHIYANDAYQLYESTNAGQSWTRAEKIGDDWVNMAFDAKDNAVVTADRNAYAYEPKGEKWSDRSGNLEVTEFYDISLTPQNASLAFGIAQDHTAPAKYSGSILWDFIPKNTDETGKMLIDPKNSLWLYVTYPLNPATLVDRSTDGGATWKTILVNNAFQAEDYDLAYAVQKSFVMDPGQTKRLLLGLTRVYETKDATVPDPSWTPISKVLSKSPDVGGQYITALAIAPSNGKVVYAATADGSVWTTTDDGQNWKENGAGLAGNARAVIDFRIDPSNPKRVFAVTNGRAGENIWLLDPATGKWGNICGDMPENLLMFSICADWKNPTVLYTGTSRGVYQSKDLGTHWAVFGEALPNVTVTDLQTLPTLNILAAATYGRGAWEILLAPPKTGEKPDGRPPTRPTVAPNLKRGRVTGTHRHPSDVNLLPGRVPGQPLAGPGPDPR